MIKPAAIAALFPLTISAPGAFAEGAAGVSDPARAQYNWVIQCQGCHQLNGSGSGGTPAVGGNVARFLHVEGGRDYLARVPGVAFVSLPDKDVAEVLNWMLAEYDAGNIPADFEPYTAEEVRKLRKRPLISTSVETRNTLLERVAAKEASITASGAESATGTKNK